MELEVRARGIEVDAWLSDYLRTTVAFAVWHHEPRVRRVEVDLEAVGRAVVCRLRTHPFAAADAPVQSGAIAGEVCAAVEEATSRLEVALFRDLSLHAPTPSQVAA